METALVNEVIFPLADRTEVLDDVRLLKRI